MSCLEEISGLGIDMFVDELGHISSCERREVRAVELRVDGGAAV